VRTFTNRRPERSLSRQIDLTANAPDARYVVYGLLFLDVFGAQSGVSYPRLATTLVRGGADYHRAWTASRR